MGETDLLERRAIAPSSDAGEVIDVTDQALKKLGGEAIVGLQTDEQQVVGKKVGGLAIMEDVAGHSYGALPGNRFRLPRDINRLVPAGLGFLSPTVMPPQRPARLRPEQ